MEYLRHRIDKRISHFMKIEFSAESVHLILYVLNSRSGRRIDSSEPFANFIEIE